MLWTANLLNGSMAQNTSMPNMQDWKEGARTFEDMAAYRESDGALIVGGFDVEIVGVGVIRRLRLNRR